MTDYTDKTDAELDALAAERMWVNEWTDYARDYTGPFPMFFRSCVGIVVYLGGGEPTKENWSPITDANDRDEWVSWLNAQGMDVSIDWWPGRIEAAVAIAPQAGSLVHAETAGRAVVVAGLRATDD